MIVFDLKCGQSHVFEAWFGSTADYDAQRARNLLSCPLCGDPAIAKAVMAPAVAPKGNRAPAAAPADAPGDAGTKSRLAELAKAQRALEAQAEHVGRDFARRARAAHAAAAHAAPEAPAPKPLIGEATPAEARALIEDGIPVAPLPFRTRRALDA